MGRAQDNSRGDRKRHYLLLEKFKKAYVLGNSIVYTNFPDFNHYTVIF